MEETEFTDVTTTITRAKTGQRKTVPELPRYANRWPFGTEPHVGTIEPPLLLVRYGR